MENVSKEISFRRHVIPEDEHSVREILNSSGFFRAEEEDVAAELLAEVLAKGEESGYHFIFATYEGETSGFACFGPVPCTVGSYDLYWIAVHEAFRNKGTGRKMLLEVENIVNELKGRQLFIETSSSEKYNPTRKFYLRSGYVEVARIADFYQQNDDKIIYVKRFDDLNS